MRRQRLESETGGFSLVETMFAVGLVATFFVALFAISSQCLFFVNASREVMTAGQTGQTRMEQIRNCTWSQITDPNYIKNSLLNTSPTGASSLGSVTEVITVNAFPTAVTPVMQVTRAADGTTTINSSNGAIASGDMATVNLQVSWNSAPGRRARTIVLSTIWAENSR